jgi:hypothetical protein
MTMTKEEKKKIVLDYLREKGDWASPTEIGDEVIPHSPNTSGSSVASPVCKSLVMDGLIERSRQGKYRALDKL